MGLRDKIFGKFKTQNETTSKTGSPSDDSHRPSVQTDKVYTNNVPESAQKETALNGLLGGLEKASQVLIKCDLDEESVTRYSLMLNQMKNEINGLQVALTIADLYEALDTIISSTLPDVLFLGDDAQIQTVKEIIHDGIKALPGTVKEQTLASINIFIVATQGAIWVTDSGLERLYKDLDEAEDKYRANRTNERLKKVKISISGQIAVLEDQKESENAELENLKIQKRSIENDTLGIGIISLHHRIVSFLKSLPSAEERVQAIEQVKDISERIDARISSENTVIARALGKTEDELLTFDSSASRAVASSENKATQTVNNNTEGGTASDSPIAIDTDA